MTARKRQQTIHEAEDGSLYIVSHNGRIIRFDQRDRALVEEFTWSALHVGGHAWYAVTTYRAEHGERRGPREYMHRLISKPLRDGRVWDHVNHDGLDNRRANLRAVTPLENARNRRDPKAKYGEAREFFWWAMAQETDECIEWPFSRNYKGYGSIQMRSMGYHTPINVHHLACVVAYGPMPEGMEAAHGPCHNRACINPRHLAWETPAQNQRDRVRDGTANGKSNLLVRDIREIRQQWATGEWTMKELAQEFGASYPNVNHIISGRRHKDV